VGAVWHPLNNPSAIAPPTMIACRMGFAIPSVEHEQMLRHSSRHFKTQRSRSALIQRVVEGKNGWG
jgi:hypothetical protein